MGKGSKDWCGSERVKSALFILSTTYWVWLQSKILNYVENSRKCRNYVENVENYVENSNAWRFKNE